MIKKVHYILFLTLLFTVGLKAQDPGKDNLTHLWTFEDGTTDDMVGNAPGEFNGDNIDLIDGDLVTFPNADGVGDSWLDLPGDELDLGSYTEVSVSAWFTPDSASNTQWNTIWFFGDDGAGAGTGSDGMALQARRGDGHARFWFTAGAAAGYNAEDGVNDVDYGNYNNNVLYHVVCEVTADNEIIMYHDGVLIGTTPLTTNPATGEIKSIADISPNFAMFCQSGYAGTGDLAWVGAIHEIAIFNKALSDEEVAFLFNAGVNGYPTAVKDKNPKVPEAFNLSQNYPNPFNPRTTIAFDLPKPGNTSLIVYDVLGKPVATLINGELKAGHHTINFSASNLSGGVYFYSLNSGDFSSTKKFILLK
jgi:hypothetical protein